MITDAYIYLYCATGRFTGIEEKTTGIFLRGHCTSSKLHKFLTFYFSFDFFAPKQMRIGHFYDLHQSSDLKNLSLIK